LERRAEADRNLAIARTSQINETTNTTTATTAIPTPFATTSSIAPINTNRLAMTNLYLASHILTARQSMESIISLALGGSGRSSCMGG
jgi:hypothetical protein